jgi:hypothetical protein
MLNYRIFSKNIIKLASKSLIYPKIKIKKIQLNLKQLNFLKEYFKNYSLIFPFLFLFYSLKNPKTFKALKY